MGESRLLDYYGCAFRVLAVFRQLLTHGRKFDPKSYMSLFNLKLCTHIWSTNINFRLPPYIGLFGPSCFELSPYG